MNVELLLNRVKESQEVQGPVSMGRIKEQWLEIFEQGTDPEGHEVAYAYWVRQNDSREAGYDVVEIDMENPDYVDLELAHNFPQQ